MSNNLFKELKRKFNFFVGDFMVFFSICGFSVFFKYGKGIKGIFYVF